MSETYFVHREGMQSWFENDTEIHAESLRAAKRQASELNEYGMNTILLDSEGNSICYRRFYQCNDGSYGHRPWRDCRF